MTFTQKEDWMDGNIFLKCMAYFVEQAWPTSEQTVLIIFDKRISYKNSTKLRQRKSCYPIAAIEK